MSQFTIGLEHVSDVTSAAVKASATKAVPIVRSTPTIIPNRRFMTEISSDEKIGTRFLVLSSTYRIISPELDRRLPY